MSKDNVITDQNGTPIQFLVTPQGMTATPTGEPKPVYPPGKTGAHVIVDGKDKNGVPGGKNDKSKKKPDAKKEEGKVASPAKGPNKPAYKPNTIGRLQVRETATPKLVKKDGNCDEAYNKAKKDWENRSWIDRNLLAPESEKTIWGGSAAVANAKQFRDTCRAAPASMDPKALDDRWQKFQDHSSGKTPLSPEESLKLRNEISTLQQIYKPGETYAMSSPSAAEEAYLANKQMSFENSIAIGFMGPLFGAPAAITRVLGGSEQQVRAGVEAGAILMDAATTAAMVPKRGPLQVAPVRRGTYVERPVVKAPPKTRTQAGEPIDVVTGEVIYEDEDFTLPGALPIRLARLHLSGSPVHGCFGPTWHSTWGQYITATRDEVLFYAEDGYPYTFERPALGESAVHVTQRKVRVTAVAGGWEIHNERNQTLTFTARHHDQYRLTSIADRNGNAIRFHYDAGALRQVIHSGGYCLRVEGEPYAITRVLLVDGKDEPQELIRYRYHKSGALAGIYNSSGKPHTFEYDDAHRMTRWEDRRGNWYGYTYDAQGRCIAGNGIQNVFANFFEYDADNRRTVFIDSFGARTTYHYNAQQLVTRTDHPDGSSNHAEWDGLGNQSSQTDGNGATTEFDHDPYGNLIAITNPLGQRTSITYDASHQAISLTDTAGVQWVRRYDARGNLIASGVKDGPCYRYERNGQGHLIRTTDPSGNSASFGYDSAGCLLWSTGAVAGNEVGPTTRFERDRQGRIIRRTDALGRTTAYRYHALGKLAQLILPDGARLSWDYDPENNLIQHQDANQNVWRYAYGAFDKLAAVDAPQGGRTCYRYDAELRLTSVINPLGLHHHYDYTATGRLASETDFDGRTTVYEYDPGARLIRHTAPHGGVTTYRRNALGQLLAKTSPDQFTLFDYNAYGQLNNALSYPRTEQDDPAADDFVQLWQRAPDAVITFERDVFGRVIQESQNGRTIGSHYNACGQRTSRTTDSGQHSAWAYDPNGLPRELRLAGDEQFHFLRDAAGRETGRRIFGKQDPGRAQAGHQRFAGAGEGFAMRNDYDLQDRLIRQWAGDADTLAERDIEYDPMGQATRITDVRWGEDQFRYDKAGQIAQRSTQLPVRPGQQAAQAHELYRYDLAGNLLATTRKNSRTGTGNSAGDGSEQQLAYRRLQLQQQGDTRYRYDAAGRLIERIDGKRWNRTGSTDGRRVWHYQWNSDNRLAAVITPEGDKWQYRYDALGRRLSKQGPHTRIHYLWDQYTIAEEVTQTHNPDSGAWEESIAIWDHEPGSFRPVSKTVIKDGKRQSYAVITDLAGMPRELITTEGQAAWIGKTTLWGEMEEEHAHKEYGTDCKLRFPGQWYDAESRLCYNFHRYYDAETARYVSPDPLGLAGGMNAYAYVHNPLGWCDPFGLQKETYYRTMSEKDYQEFLKTNKIPATGETFISPTEAYSQKYDGVLVKFEVAPGTTAQLQEIGFKNNASELSNLNLPTSAENWTQNNAYFKWETPKGGVGQMNIGLGKGPALNIFNNNIQNHEVLRR